MSTFKLTKGHSEQLLGHQSREAKNLNALHFVNNYFLQCVNSRRMKCLTKQKRTIVISSGRHCETQSQPMWRKWHQSSLFMTEDI